MALDKIKYAISADTLGKSGDYYIARRSYFYSFGKSEKDLANNILKVFPNAKIIRMGNHRAPFRGGSSVKAGSHFWVEFNINKEELNLYMRSN